MDTRCTWLRLSHCQVDPRLASFRVIPCSLQQLEARVILPGSKPGGVSCGGSSLKLRTLAREWLGATDATWGGTPAARSLIDQLQPDLIHAMRIPYEGMLAALSGAAGAFSFPCGATISPCTAGPRPGWRPLTRRRCSAPTHRHTDCLWNAEDGEGVGILSSTGTVHRAARLGRRHTGSFSPAAGVEWEDLTRIPALTRAFSACMCVFYFRPSRVCWL